MNEPQGKDSVAAEFLFREDEFDGEEFDAAQFVARYRRVTTLESLREQLVNYNQHVRRQLYAVINRDYKDFITITTKLDGLDTRTEMMIKPLFGLQLDLSSLQNGISGSLHLIQDKLDQHREVLQKKAAIQKLLRVSTNMELAKSALNISQNTSLPTLNTSAPTSRRNALYRQRNIPSDSQDKDLFVCSEYERAAVALKESHQDLTAITQDMSLLHGAAAPQLVSDLQRNFMAVQDNLVSHLRSYLEHVFSAASTQQVAAPTTNCTSTMALGSRDVSSRCYTHCLRALLHLKQGQVAEKALRTAVLDPYLKSLLIASKIDGKAGRGTYSGLKATLQEFLEWLDRSQLKQLLHMAEDNVIVLSASISSSSSPTAEAPLNLVIQGVWQSLQTLLGERCPSMSSVGLTHVFSRCFRALDSFLQGLQSRFPRSFAHAVFAAPAEQSLSKYWAAWKTELYLQLRTREVYTRVDAICAAHITALTAAKNKTRSGGLLDQAYRPMTAAGSSGGGGVGGGDSPAVVSAGDVLRSALQAPLSLEADTLSALVSASINNNSSSSSSSSTTTNNNSNNNNSKWAAEDEFLRVMVVEARVLLHEDVALRPLRGQCASLLLRLLHRLSLHLAFLGQTTSLSLSTVEGGSSGAAFDLARVEYLQGLLRGSAAGPAVPSSSAGMSSATPVPPTVPVNTPATSVPGTPTPPMQHAQTAPAGAVSMTQVPLPPALETWANSVEDLMQHVQHLLRVHAELQRLLVAEWGQWWPAGAEVERMVRRGLQPLLHVARALWQRVLQLVTVDARRPLLAGVKSIAGKYRMTNKPPPVQPSSYVSTVAEPWERLLALRGVSISELVERLAKLLQEDDASSAAGDAVRGWKTQLAGEVAESFQEQIVTLLETVRQMDEALQRRQRTPALAAANAASAALTDSDKIHMQVRLDVEDYARRVWVFLALPAMSAQEKGLSDAERAALVQHVPAFQALWNTLKPASDK